MAAVRPKILTQNERALRVPHGMSGLAIMVAWAFVSLLVSGCGDSSVGPTNQPTCDAGMELCGDQCVAQGTCSCTPACGQGETCQGGTCVPGCGDTQTDPNNCGACGLVCGAGQVCSGGICGTACQPGQSICDGACVDTQSNSLHCGSCGQTCGVAQECINGGCGCAQGFQDCDGNPTNGCETAGTCDCSEGETRDCYNGPDGTNGVGRCSGGTQTCNQGRWSVCAGATTPIIEVCGNNIDDNCNGQTDEDGDADGDGYSRCAGDCCDVPGSDCATDPSRVNPGAFDFVGNSLDDDCDGMVDNPPPSGCSALQALTNTDGKALAQAMELCDFIEEGSGYGVVSAEIFLANGSPGVSDEQTAVLADLGSGIGADTGATMAALSSGTARAVDDPGYVNPNDSVEFGTLALPPSSYSSAHGGMLETAPGCPSGSGAVRDSAMLRLQLQVPTNAQGFSFRFRFLTAEYPAWLCSQFNDFFLVLLRSGHPDIPADGNISFDSGGNPVSVNNAFFTTCEAQACDGSGNGTDDNGDGCPDSQTCTANQCATSIGACPDGASELTGYTADAGTSGGTSWLTTQAPVLPGETITLEFHIWDTSDSKLDSLILLDSFAWKIEATEVDTFN